MHEVDDEENYFLTLVGKPGVASGVIFVNIDYPHLLSEKVDGKNQVSELMDLPHYNPVPNFNVLQQIIEKVVDQFKVVEHVLKKQVD